MKNILATILTMSLSLFANAQLAHFSGALQPLNNSPVSGYFTGLFDYKTSTAVVSGVATSYANSVSTTPIKSLILPIVPTTGLIYNLSDLNFVPVSVNKTSESTFNNSFDVYGLKLFVFVKNEFYSFNTSFKVNSTNEYTFLLNSGSLPVAYGTFTPAPTPVPEPEYMALAGGLLLTGFVSVRKIKGYSMDRVIRR